MFLNPKKVLANTHISPGMFVADFETTNGVFALEVARLLKNDGKVFCVGSQGELLRRVSNEATREHLGTLEIIKGHIEKSKGVPLKDGILDLVIIENSFFTLENKDITAHEANRLLRNGGRVLLVEWIDSFGGIGPHKDHVVSKSDVLAHFKNAGFSLMKEIDADDFHYAYIFQKKI